MEWQAHPAQCLDLLRFDLSAGQDHKFILV
jgi:hypothetical protein